MNIITEKHDSLCRSLVDALLPLYPSLTRCDISLKLKFEDKSLVTTDYTANITHLNPPKK